jgi:hypothetical protein
MYPCVLGALAWILASPGDTLMKVLIYGETFSISAWNHLFDRLTALGTDTFKQD